MPTVAAFPFYRVGATPLALEIMRVFNAGSSVYANVYSDAGGTVPMANSAGAPIQADGNGLFPVVFAPIGAAYDIKFFSPLLAPRDTYLGIVPASGGSGGGLSSYQVKSDSGDTSPGYLSDKLIDSTTVNWTDIDVGGGVKKMVATVDPAYVLDHKIVTDTSDSIPGYLADKIESTPSVSLSIDPVTKKLQANVTSEVALNIIEIPSFPDSEIVFPWPEDPDSMFWQPAGCFCWILPASNFGRIKYIKSMFGGSAGIPLGRYSIWGWISPAAAPVSIYDDSLPDNNSVSIFPLDLDVSMYALIGIAMDPGLIGPGQPVKQFAMSGGSVTPSAFPRPFAYIGSHTHNTTFATWPEPISSDPRYLLTKWMALGVTY